MGARTIILRRAVYNYLLLLNALDDQGVQAGVGDSIQEGDTAGRVMRDIVCLNKMLSKSDTA